MIWTMFKTNLKNNRFILILMTTVFCFYMTIIMSMFDPKSIATLNELMKAMPEAMIKAMNFEALGTTLLTFISGYIYGFLVFLFPMVLVIVVNHRLVASMVDKGSMAYLLATPHTRSKIVVAQAIFSLFSATFIFAFTTGYTILLSQILFPSELEVGKFILLNLYALLMYYAIGGICFIASVIANESKTSLGIGVGVPILFLVLQMIGNAGDKFSWMGKLSMYALFDVSLVTEGSPSLGLYMGLFFIIAVALYGIGIVIFNRKNLYL